jgi:SsrA-binding protein
VFEGFLVCSCAEVLENTRKCCFVFKSPPLRTRCRRGESFAASNRRRDAEAAEKTQRRAEIRDTIKVNRSLVPGSLACYSQISFAHNLIMTAATQEKVLATNRAAFHNYHISAKYEAGAALLGTEVKSVLDGRIQLKESYVGVRDGEAWLFNAHISPYTFGNLANHEPLRTRKLLLHRREIAKLDEATTIQGMTLVVTRVYLKSRKIKFEVGVAKGKKLYDKRETEMRRIVERETQAQLKERNR